MRNVMLALALAPFAAFGSAAAETTTPVALPHAAENAIERPGVAPASESPSATPTPVVTRLRSPLALAIEHRLELERAALAELQRRFAQARDPRAARAIQREIAAAKAETEIDLMRIQADFARRAGRLDVAERIEQAIAEILELRTARERATVARATTVTPQAAPQAPPAGAR